MNNNSINAPNELLEIKVIKCIKLYNKLQIKSGSTNPPIKYPEGALDKNNFSEYAEWIYLFQFAKEIQESLYNTIHYEIKNAKFLLDEDKEIELAALLKCASPKPDPNSGSFNSPDLSRRGRLLKNYSFSKIDYDSFCNFEYEVQTKEHRRIITFNFPGDMLKSNIKFPKKATHFKYFVTATKVPFILFRELTLKPLPSFVTDFYSSERILPKPLHPSSKFNYPAPGMFMEDAIFTHESILLCIGLQFYNNMDGIVTSEKEWVVMKVLGVI